MVLLLGAAFSLPAQSPKDVSVFIPPVSGTGITPEDNAFFFDVLAREVGAWDFMLAQAPNEADYVLVSSIVPPHMADEGIAAQETGDDYYLYAALEDKTGTVLYAQNFYYGTTEEATRYMPGILRDFISNVVAMLFPAPGEKIEVIRVVEQRPPERKVDPNAWRNKRWYIGIGAFWNPRLYQGSRLSSNLFNFGLGFSAEFYLLQFLALGSGVELATDWVVASPRASDAYRNMIVQIPLSLNFALKPGDKYMHELYGGAYFNIPLFSDTTVPLFSWKAGFQFGVKAGQGIAFADARFSMDFGKAGLDSGRPSDTRQYTRYMAYLGIGYKYGFRDIK